jgi:NitT/TauT family transport system substrate-binding protein
MHVSAKPTSVLAVAFASPIKDARGLTGKTIATPTLHELIQTAVMSWIDKNGGDSKTVSFIEMPQSAMAAALAVGRIDAGFIAEPFFSEARALKQVRFLSPAYDGISKRFMVTGWLGTPKWIEQNTPAAKAFASAIKRGAQWGAANPGPSAAILAKYTKLAPEVLALMNRSTFPPALDAALIQPVIDVSVQYGTMPAKFSAVELIAPAFRS